MILCFCSVKWLAHQRKHQPKHRHDNDNASDDTIQYPDAAQVELRTDFIYKVSNAKPPRQRPQRNSQVSGDRFKHQYPLTDEGKACKEADKEEYNKWIG